MVSLRGKDWCYVQKFILTHVFKFMCVCTYTHIFMYDGWFGSFLLYVFSCPRRIGERIKSLRLINSGKETFTR